MDRRRHRINLPPVRSSQSRKTRNPNRWLVYGFGLGLALGWAIDLIGIGVIVGLFTGMMLRNRDMEEAQEEAQRLSELAPGPDEIVH